MTQFPSLPLFTDAYLADTIHLSTVEHGAYLLLLISSWRVPDCTLPDDDKFLAKITRMRLARWKAIRPIMEAFFIIENGKWNQKRLQKERLWVTSRHQTRIDNGRKGGRPSSPKPLINNEADKATGYVSVKLNETEPKAPIPIPIPIPKEKKEFNKKNLRRFDEFWKAFEWKRGIAGAQKSWAAINPDDSLADEIIAGAKRYAAWRKAETNQTSFKMAQGWLTDKRWLDVIDKPKGRYAETNADFGAEDTEHRVITKSTPEELARF